MMPEREVELFVKLDMPTDQVKGEGVRVMAFEIGQSTMAGRLVQIGQRIDDVGARLPLPIACRPPAAAGNHI